MKDLNLQCVKYVLCQKTAKRELKWVPEFQPPKSMPVNDLPIGWLRELVNVFQGLLAMRPETYTGPRHVVRLWYHECSRVFGDRLTTTVETQRFTKMLIDCTKKNFEVGF